MSPEKLAEVREEIGDVIIYLVELADKLGIDPVEAARARVLGKWRTLRNLGALTRPLIPEDSPILPTAPCYHSQHATLVATQVSDVEVM
jgi:hypothetical protein